METKERVRQELLDKYDADELVDILGILPEELLSRFDDKVDDYIEEDTDDDEDNQ